MLCDGLSAAIRLRTGDRQAFGLLCRLPFRFVAERNPQERYHAYGCLIVTDRDGDIAGVRFSDRTLGVHDMDEDEIEPAYRALRAFAAELYGADLAYRHKLRPGECHIKQCSVDREEFHNSYRRLAEKLGRMDDAAAILPGDALG